MIPLFLAFTLFAQSAALQSDNGTITGTLKTASGPPAIGVRVAAMAVPDSALDAINSAALVSLAETDIEGHFRLENIVPGRYYVTAGRVDAPTFFPGAIDISGGKIISVTSKAMITNIDFTMENISLAYAGSASANIRTGLGVAVQVSMENGVKQPVSADGNFVTLGLTRTADGARSDEPLTSTVIAASIPAPLIGAEYRVSIDNLPDGYVVKSIKYGATDLMTDTLKVTSANFQQLTNGNAGAVTSLANLPTNPNDLQTYLLQMAQQRGGTGIITLNVAGNGGTMVASIPSLLAASAVTGTPTSSIVVTLGTVPSSSSPPAGIRVTGKAPVRGAWSIYRGDIPGTFYSDGSFELRGVPPGRHIVVLQDGSPVPHLLAAIITVTDRDLDGVTLDEAGILPKSIDKPPAPISAANTLGSFQALAGIQGRVLEDEGGQPLSQGIVTIMGRTLATIPINPGGQFEFPHLLPGSYDLRIEAFEHFTLYETVVVTDRDVHQEFRVRSNQETAADVTSEPEAPH